MEIERRERGRLGYELSMVRRTIFGDDGLQKPFHAKDLLACILTTSFVRLVELY